MDTCYGRMKMIRGRKKAAKIFNIVSHPLKEYIISKYSFFSPDVAATEIQLCRRWQEASKQINHGKQFILFECEQACVVKCAGTISFSTASKHIFDTY